MSECSDDLNSKLITEIRHICWESNTFSKGGGGGGGQKVPPFAKDITYLVEGEFIFEAIFFPFSNF